jgi:tetrahydromethanopterin S-methyltransferase subunit C
MKKEDIALVSGIIAFILIAFVLIVTLKYNEVVSFIIAAIMGIIVNQLINRL